jgi:hypothetical protein
MISRRMKIILMAQIFLGIAVAVAGLVVRGPRDDRFVPGGLCLFIAAVTSIVAYSQVRTGKVLVRDSIWSNRFYWIDKQDRLVRYWLTTIMSACCSVALFVYAVIIFAFSMKMLGDR